MKHLADHRRTSTGARMTHFLRLARMNTAHVWARVWQKPVAQPKANRRAVEFARIERGREV